jgi:hypothetical protein
MDGSLWPGSRNPGYICNKHRGLTTDDADGTDKREAIMTNTEGIINERTLKL